MMHFPELKPWGSFRGRIEGREQVRAGGHCGLVWLVIALGVLLNASIASAQVILVPGSGFSGATAQPPTIAPGQPGSSAKVIGHWDIVPFQTFSGDLNVGVVAFHVNGIDRVEFSANGGPWTAVTQMTLNPQSSVVEYWATVRASDFADGSIEVRAVAYPKNAGVPRVVAYDFTLNGGGLVQGVQLFANSGNTLASQVRYVSPSGSNNNNGLTPSSAYATIAYAAQKIEDAQNGNAGGGTIYLTASQNWIMPTLSGISAPNRWLTIAAAPGLAPGQVVIKNPSHNGLPGGLLRMKDLTNMGPSSEFGGAGGGLWFEGVNSVGTDATDDHGGLSSVTTNKPKGIWATECGFSHLHVPMVKTTLARNLIMDDIGGDLFREPRCVINVHSTHHGFETSGDHSDFVQWYIPNYDSLENFIFYNVANYGSHEHLQGLYRDAGTDGCPVFDNVAFVNIHIDRVAASSARSQWINTATNHLLLWHITHHQLTCWLGSPSITNLSVRACSWEKITMPPGNVAAYGAGFQDNHYVIGSGYQVFAGGSNATTGDPMYVNANGYDFHPDKESPLRNRINPLVSYSDATGQVRSIPASVGAFDPNDEGGDCAADLNSDDVINTDDLLLVLNQWGACGGCEEDMIPPSGDGVVNVNDLLHLVTNWGSCN